MSVLDGPGQGDWSVLAEKAIAERDAALRRVSELEAEINRMWPYVDFAVAREAQWEFRIAELEAELAKLKRA